ncbi:MAG: hypothetical protein ABI036_08865 [Fibrobacteria bacterium]
MHGFQRFLAICAFCAISAAAPAKASAGSGFLEERYHAALNDMVQQVRQIPDPAAKREHLEYFLTRMQHGLQKAAAETGGSPGALSQAQQADRASLTALAEKYAAYASELNGIAGFTRVPDAGLDEFAGYVRQGSEQAAIGGGVYISSGVLILILILIILLT